MTKLNQLEKAMRPQFVWEKLPEKPLQTLETMEGAKDVARMIFVGVADMYGFKSQDVQNYLNMGFDSYRNKLSTFRSLIKEVRQRSSDGTIYTIEDSTRRFFFKVSLTLNAVKYMYGSKYLSFESLNYD